MTDRLKFICMFLLIIVFFFLNIVVGTIAIPLNDAFSILFGNDQQPQVWQNIILKSRLPQSLTAMVAGAGLVLGISNGASLGVAFVVLATGSIGGVALSSLGAVGNAAISLAAIFGAMSVMALIVYVSQKVQGNATLLIIGVMIGYVATAIIGVLKYFSNEEDIRAYVVWGLGSFSRVSGNQMELFVVLMLILIPLSMLTVKTLNILLLGEQYARNLGLNIKRARLLVIGCSSILVAIVTAYCGPIMFLGLAVPHLCRAIWRTSDHRVLMPATMLTGTALALICNLIARMPGFEGALPINSVTALIGAPVVAMVLFRRK